MTKRTDKWILTTMKICQYNSFILSFSHCHKSHMCEDETYMFKNLWLKVTFKAFVFICDKKVFLIEEIDF